MKTRLAPCDFVLIHGAWHGGWCWDEVGARLTAAGHRVHCPTLPGLAERSAELDGALGLAERSAELDGALGLADHIASVIDFIDTQQINDFVLVGHSYGGMVITGVADALKHRIAHIVYLDAALPHHGESMVSYGAPRPPEVIAAHVAMLRSLAPDGIAMQPFAAETLGIAPDHPAHALVNQRLTPHPLKTWLDPITLVDGGPRDLPRTYLLCTCPLLEHSQFAYIARLAAADPEWRYGEIASGHEAMLTAPGEVAQHLLDTLPALRHDTTDQQEYPRAMRPHL